MSSKYEGDYEDLLEHERHIADAGLWEYRDEILAIINGSLTAGLKLANNLDFKFTDDMTKKWNMIDAKKLRYVKQLCSLLSELEGESATSRTSQEPQEDTLPHKEDK